MLLELQPQLPLDFLATFGVALTGAIVFVVSIGVAFATGADNNADCGGGVIEKFQIQNNSPSPQRKYK